MLTLTRREGEGIAIGSDVEVVVLGVSRGRVRIGIRAPRSTPVHRTELVKRIEEENRKAMVQEIPADIASETAITFEHGLFGLGPLRRFVVCDVGDSASLKAMVSCDDPTMQLLIVDATEVWADYPVEEARKAGGFEEEVAIAAVATVPFDGSPATVNLMAPIVVGLESRRGVQLILDREELGMAHPIIAHRAEAVEARR